MKDAEVTALKAAVESKRNSSLQVAESKGTIELPSTVSTIQWIN